MWTLRGELSGTARTVSPITQERACDRQPDGRNRYPCGIGGRTVKRLMNHGTMSAVRRHQREKSRLCDACREEQRSRDTQRRCKAEKPVEPKKPRVDLSASLARLREYLDAREAQG